MSDRLHCPGCGIPTIEGGVDTTEEELYCNRCVEELERNMNTNKPVGGAQFTPGPWYVHSNKIAVGDRDNDRHIIADIRGMEAFGNPTPDATLIAAAPAMYEALKTLHGVLDQRMSDGRTLNQHLGKELFECFYGPAIAARAAIAKAEGV